ncbi:alpha/beta-hydrolase [Atractiella rhizophila]|nr:alpha/beta-hydrolase [Atractiella rhizophila]
MDHLNPHPNSTVSLALRRLPATSPFAERRGSLFINPGGPGGSGTEAVVEVGEYVSKIVGGRYDIVSWDPRGVNMTLPLMNCYKDKASASLGAAQLFSHGYPYQARIVPEASPYLHKGLSPLTEIQTEAVELSEMAWFRKFEALAEAHSRSCVNYGDHEFFRNLGTAATARDMKWIMEALGEDTLKYWGFSYGTTLGSTFAAMFPELTERLVLDGVMDVVSYYQDMGRGCKSSLQDNDKVYQGFIDNCAKAGPARCSLATGNSTTAMSIDQRLIKLSADLLNRPLPVSDFDLGAGVVTTHDLHMVIFMGLYKPALWPHLAESLAKLERGDGKMVRGLMAQFYDPGPHLPWDDNVFHRPFWNGYMSATKAIMCSDADPVVRQMSTYQHRDFIHEMSLVSKWSGEQWGQFASHCKSWPFEANEVYRGPWSIETGLAKPKYPILFVGNTGDPVTPLSAAKLMSQAFGKDSASLLIQDGFGHCSWGQPSACVAKGIKDYFLNGDIPEYGTVCESDPDFLFPDVSFSEHKYRTMNAEDLELQLAMEGIGSYFSTKNFLL